MKQKIYHIIIFLLFWFCGIAYSQNPKADILRQDLSGLFDNSSMIGILGEDCSRIDIHITEVRKVDNREYGIKGVSRTRLFLICPFEGNIYIDSISSCSQIMKSECTEVDGFIYGHYSFAEYGDKQYRGTFSGSFKQGYRMSGQQIEKGRNEMAELKLNLSEYRGKWKSAKGLTKSVLGQMRLYPILLQTSACLMMLANGLYHRNIVRMVGKIYIMPITMRILQRTRYKRLVKWKNRNGG